MKKAISFFAASMMALLVVSCGKPAEQPSVKLSFYSANMEAAGGELKIDVAANTAWTAGSDAAWLSVSPASGQGNATVTVTAVENQGDSRTGNVTFSWSGSPVTFKVQQRAAAKPDIEPETGIVSIQSVRDRYKGEAVKITENIYIEGTVISNYHRDGLDNNTSTKSIVVSDGTTGIMLYCTEENNTYKFGDKVKVSLRGLLVDSYENGPVQLNGVPLSVISKLGTEDVTAIEISAAEFMTGKYESVYVAVKDVQVAEADLNKTFVMNNNHTSILVEGQGGELFDIFSGKYSSFGNQKVPSGSGTLKGIGGKHGERMQICIARAGDYDGLTGERFVSASTLSLFYTEYTTSGDKGQYVIRVLGNMDWTASCDNPDFRISAASGKGAADVTLSFGDNPSTTASRVAKVTFTAVDRPDLKAVFTLTQLPFQLLVSDAVPFRLEIPAVKEQDSIVCITHEYELNGRQQYSYSAYYDARYKVSHWVAYPLYRDVLSGVTRTDAWGYDPKVPERDQAMMLKALSGYSRGHQLPSADRLINQEANEETFYFTNLTPQKESLNSGVWVDLESKLRSVVRSNSDCDTIYVVTGCVVTTADDTKVSYIQDNAGARVAVPKAYYKVCLQHRTGGSDGRYSAIGFWMEHDASLSGSLDKYAKSVDEIEALTGFDFFPNLNDEIEDAVEKAWSGVDWNL